MNINVTSGHTIRKWLALIFRLALISDCEKPHGVETLSILSFQKKPKSVAKHKFKLKLTSSCFIE